MDFRSFLYVYFFPTESPTVCYEKLPLCRMDMLYLVEMMVLQFANFSNLTESNIHYSIHIPSIVHKIPS